MKPLLRSRYSFIFAVLSLLLISGPWNEASAAFSVQQKVKIDVVAAGDTLGIAPVLGLRINGVNTASQSVTNAKGTWKTYSFDVNLSSVFNNYSVTLENYYSTGGKGRNLYIKSVAVNGVVTDPSTSSVFGTADAAKKASAQDGNLYGYGELMWSVWANPAIVAAVYGAQNVPATIVQPDKVLTDYQFFSIGPYQAFLSPWGKDTLVLNKDYTETISLNTKTFPNNVTFAATWPKTPPTKSGVYNFNSISFGNFCGARPKQSLPARRIKDIKSLTRTHDFTLTGDPQGFDVIDDIFVSAAGTEACSLPRSLIMEIEIFYHTPQYSLDYTKSGKKIGTVTISGISWDVSMDAGWRDILIVPSNHQDLPGKAIDMKAVFDYLVSQKLLTGNEWFNGFGFGTETRYGAGGMKVNSYSVNLQ